MGGLELLVHILNPDTWDFPHLVQCLFLFIVAVVLVFVVAPQGPQAP